jgi:hypothetical protein
MAIHSGLFYDLANWKERVNYFFDENPLCPSYRDACLEKDLEKAKQELEKGAFPDYFLDPAEDCGCGLDGCIDSYLSEGDLFEDMAIYFHFKDEFLLLLDYGLARQN